MNLAILSRCFASVLLAGLVLSTGCTRKAKAQRHLDAANGYFTADQYDKAEIEYLNVLKLDRTNLTAIRSLGAIFYANDQILRSLPFLNTVKKLAPADIDSRGKLARLYSTVGATKEAREEANFVLQSAPTNETALLVLIDLATKPEELKAVRQQVNGLRQKAGDRALFHVANGYLSTKEGDTRTAEAEFKAAVSIEAKSPLALWALGNHYLSQTNLALAESALKASADLSPLRSGRRLRLITLKLQLKDSATAKSMLEEICTKAPDYLPAWLYSARLALLEKNLEKAGASIERALGRDPDGFEALSLRAELRLADGKFDKGLADLDRLATLYPKSAAVRYQQGVANLLNRDTVKAIAALTQAVAIEPNFSQAAMMLAELKSSKGEPIQAITAMTELIKKQPENDTAYLILAAAYQSAGRNTDAIATYEKMMQRFPNNVQAPLLLGRAQRQQGNNAEGRKAFEKALQSKPDDATAIAQLVDLDINDKKFDIAAQRVQQWMAKSPKDAEPVFQMAKIRAAQNDTNGAMELLDKGLQLNANAIPAYIMLARLQLSTGQADQALKTCDLALQKSPKDSSVLLLNAMIYAEKKDYPNSRDLYEKLLAIVPNSGVALNNLASLYADQFNQLEKAYPLARKAQELNPDDPNTADTYGWILARRGELGLALGHLKLSAQKRPNDAEILGHLGLTHYLLGDEVSARAALEQALKLNPVFNDRPEAEKALAVLNINPASIDAKLTTFLEGLLAEKPADTVAIARVAEAYKRAGQTGRIVAAYEKALAASPNMVAVMVKLAELYSENPETQGKSLELAKNARKLAPEDPKVAQVAGRAALRSTELKEQQWAVSLLQESSQKQASSPEAQYDLALAYYSQGRLSDAEKLMKVALGSGSNPAVTAAANRFLEFLPMNLDAARASQGLIKVEDILKSDPNYVPALVARAAASEQTNPNLAVKSYEAVLARYPGFAPAIRGLALLLVGQPGDNAKALALSSKAKELFPDDPNVSKAFGFALYQSGDYAKAVRQLADGAKKLQKDARLQYTLGMAHFKLKQNQESKVALNKALALAPGSSFEADAKRTLSELK